jgi:hypothetical protein
MRPADEIDPGADHRDARAALCDAATAWSPDVIRRAIAWGEAQERRRAADQMAAPMAGRTGNRTRIRRI